MGHTHKKENKKEPYKQTQPQALNQYYLHYRAFLQDVWMADNIHKTEDWNELDGLSHNATGDSGSGNPTKHTQDLGNNLKQSLAPSALTAPF